MLRQLPALEDDPALFDPSPEWFVSGLKASLRDDEEGDDGLGFRSLIEQPEALSKAWRTTGWEPSRSRRHHAKPHPRSRSLRCSHTA